MIKRLLVKFKLIKQHKPKMITSCSCNNGIIICPSCNGIQSNFGICACCNDSGIRTCGKCNGFCKKWNINNMLIKYEKFKDLILKENSFIIEGIDVDELKKQFHLIKFMKKVSIHQY